MSSPLTPLPCGGGGAGQEFELDTSKDAGGEGQSWFFEDQCRVRQHPSLTTQYAIRMNFDDAIVGSPVDYESLEFDLLWDTESTISADAFQRQPGRWRLLHGFRHSRRWPGLAW